MDTWTTSIGIPAGMLPGEAHITTVKNTSKYTITIYEIVTDKASGRKVLVNPVKVAPNDTTRAFDGRSDLSILLYINGLIPDNFGNLSQGWVTIEYGWSK